MGDKVFCVQCGAKINKNYKFCPTCGSLVGRTTNSELLQIKCASCGGVLEISPDSRYAECLYCHSKFLIERVNTNFNINSDKGIFINSANVDISKAQLINYIKRAEEYTEKCWFNTALEYYDKALDIDAESKQARAGITNIRKKIADYIYYEGVSRNLFSRDDYFYVKKDRIILKNSKTGDEKVYLFKNIENMSFNATEISFSYPSKMEAVNQLFSLTLDLCLPLDFDKVKIFCQGANDIGKFIINAQKGILPKFK